MIADRHRPTFRLPHHSSALALKESAVQPKLLLGEDSGWSPPDVDLADTRQPNAPACACFRCRLGRWSTSKFGTLRRCRNTNGTFNRCASRLFSSERALCVRLRFHGMEEVVSSNLTRSTNTPQTLTEPPPRSTSRSGSKTNLIRPGSRGRHGMHGALFSRLRDGDNTSFPLCVRESPTTPTGTTGRLASLVSMGYVLSGFLASRDEAHLARTVPTRPTIPMPALARRNSTIAICVFIDGHTVPF